MHHMCKKCGMLAGALLLVLGVLFLLRDLGVWDFWNVQWWTALILFAGLAHLGTSNCPECQKLRK